MRTTLNLDDDVLAVVQRVRDRDGVGLSEAVNRLIRAGIVQGKARHQPYQHRAVDLGLRLDVANIGEVLDALDAEPS